MNEPPVESEELVSSIRLEARERMLHDHPHLIENFLARLDSDDPIDRLYLGRAVLAIMDVIEAKTRAEEAHCIPYENPNVA